MTIIFSNNRKNCGRVITQPKLKDTQGLIENKVSFKIVKKKSNESEEKIFFF